uniref:hybrid sensor histidine kinase/response regulator n=2 Tax=Polynucleobacter sp. TaxID=2029855 RepID=UPI0040471820
MQSYKTIDIKKIKREVFFKYKYHVATIFLVFFIFSFGIFRSIKAIEYMEQDAISYQTLKKNNDWGKINESLQLEIKKIDQLNLDIKKEVEQQLIKENGNLKKISINKIYEKFPKLDDINIELGLLDPQGAPIEHQENPAYANKGNIEKSVLEEFNADLNKGHSFVFSKKETKKIVFLRSLELQNKDISGLLSIEIIPKILLSFLDPEEANLFEYIYIFDNKNMAVYGESFQKNLSRRDIKFNDFSSLVNIKKDGGILFNGPPIVNAPVSWAAFSTKKYFLSDWLEIKEIRVRNLLLVSTVMLLSIILLVYFFKTFLRSELSNRINTIELKNNIQAKEDVVSLISHEIRAPLNVIFGLSQLSEDTSITKEELIKNNVSIKSATKYLTKLLNEILTFNKLTAENFSLDENFHKIEHIFNNLRSLFNSRNKNDVRIIFGNNVPKNVLIKCDDFQMQQALTNLLENSLKFTRQGSVEIDAEEISRGEETVIIRFAVSDTGIGIKKSEQQFIFEPFMQANPTIIRDYGGTGLGLAISKRIVERLGGKLEFTSEEGTGSCFYFDIEFNFEIDDTTQTDLSDSTINPSPAKIDFDSLHMNGRVLIVDDHATTLQLMEKFLQKIGLSVTTALNGEDAIKEVTSNNRFDMIIMDVQMPGLSGIDTTKIIRLYEDENQIQRVPIISLSANTSEKNIEDCILAGMDDFIQKPADFNKVHQVINTWIRG